MLSTRTYRNNLGYQVDIDRKHPILLQELNRYNRNYYTYDGYNTKMDYNKGGDKGLQYGGASSNNKKIITTGKGIDPITAVKTLQLLYTGAKAASSLYSSEPATMIKNTYGKFMNPEGTWRPGFAGEKHLMSKKGLTYNFCGPGTNLEQRLIRGDPGLDEEGLDLTCKIHDIDYYNAKNWSDVRKADKKFIKNLDKTDLGVVSKTFIKGLFKGKMIGEDIGVISKEKFTSFPNIQTEVPPKIEENQPTVDISGQGNIFTKNTDPARKLKNKIKKYRKKKHKDRLLNIAFESIRKRLKK